MNEHVPPSYEVVSEEVTRNLNSLEGKGMVEQKDGYVHLTERGKSAVRMMRRQLAEATYAAFEVFINETVSRGEDPEDPTVLMRWLIRLWDEEGLT